MISFNDAFVQAYLDAQRRQPVKETGDASKKLWSLVEEKSALDDDRLLPPVYKDENSLVQLLHDAPITEVDAKLYDSGIQGTRMERQEQRRIETKGRIGAGLIAAKEALDMRDYWQEVYDAAYKKYGDHEKASRAAHEASAIVGMGIAGQLGTTAVNSVTGGFLGLGIGSLKKWAKGKALEDYTPPEWDGTTSD